jgi:hypothetical protein
LVAWVGAIGRPHSDRDAHVGEWRVLFIPDDFVRGAWSIVRLAFDAACAAAFGAVLGRHGHRNFDLHCWTPALAPNERVVGDQTAGASLWTKIA